MKLTVVIPVYNASETITEQMEALSEQTWEYPWEVIVVDNGSTDNSIELVKNYQEKIENLRIVEAYERKGAAYARNVGVKNSEGENLAFCDADDIVGENYIAAIGEALFEHDFVACKWELNKINDPEIVKSRGKGQSEGLMSYSLCDYLPHAAGCSLGIKKKIHEEVGGFDEAFPYLQDTDYCWKVQLKGYELTYIPDAVVHYRFRYDTRNMFKQSMNWGEYSVLLYKKYKDKGMPKRPIKSSLRSIYSILRTSRALVISKETRNRWLTRFARILGRLKGSVKYKTFVA